MVSILLVEDNPDNADLVCAYLEDEHEITVCVNGQDALDHLDGNAGALPQLAFLDISLPGMDGTELLRCVRRDARFEHIPCIALTAHAMKDDRNRLLAVGFDDYISKPITDDTVLREAVDRYAGGRHRET